MVDFLHIGSDVKGAVFVQDFAGNHGQLHILLAAAVHQIFADVVDRLHVRLIQINDNQIRL